MAKQTKSTGNCYRSSHCEERISPFILNCTNNPCLLRNCFVPISAYPQKPILMNAVITSKCFSLCIFLNKGLDCLFRFTIKEISLMRPDGSNYFKSILPQKEYTLSILFYVLQEHYKIYNKINKK